MWLKTLSNRAMGCRYGVVDSPLDFGSEAPGLIPDSGATLFFWGIWQTIAYLTKNQNVYIQAATSEYMYMYICHVLIRK